MKTLVLLFCFLVPALVGAQHEHGGVRLQLRNATADCRYDAVQLIAFRDSTALDTITTDDSGTAMLLNLPVGEVWISARDGQHELGRFAVHIQLYQLLNRTVLINDLPSTGQLAESREGTPVPGEGSDVATRVTITREDIAQLPAMRTESIGQIEEVVVACRMPLLSPCNLSSVVYSDRYKDHIVANSQTDLLESRVGGLTNPNGEIHVRGARADAGYYYIDGVKVRGSAKIPNSAIDQVTVITGGVPANYGDVTGGVVSITTKSYTSYSSERYRRERSSRNSAVSYQQEPEPDPVFTTIDEWGRDQFLPIYENLFLSPLDAPHSTFGTDVDQASWGFVQSQLKEGRSVPRDAVKLEEMINAFDHKFPEVPEGNDLALTFLRMSCPWNTEHELVAVQLRAKELPQPQQRPPHNFVFLVDVSGSMTSVNKLPLLQEGLESFVETLQPNDRVSLVTYAGSSGVVLEPTLCTEKNAILTAIRDLSAGGSTNGIGGIQMAYQLATDYFLPNGNNRIILCTDGDFNVGISNPHELEEYIGSQRGKGIYLTALGFGMGNYRNDILETLADRGDGNHFYIASLNDCREVLEKKIGNLLNLARDVKLNVEFNPKLVAGYRLIGYENRLMPSAHFRDDTKDGGEIGYGHTVTAVYEIEPGKAAETLDAHFSKIKPTANRDDLCKVSLRYKLLEAETSTEESHLLPADEVVTEQPLLQTIIAFGLELRQSTYKGSCNEALLRELSDKLGKTEQEELLRGTIALCLEQGRK